LLVRAFGEVNTYFHVITRRLFPDLPNRQRLPETRLLTWSRQQKLPPPPRARIKQLVSKL